MEKKSRKAAAPKRAPAVKKECKGAEEFTPEMRLLDQCAASCQRRNYGGNARNARRRLLSAGLMIFAEKGYERARIREICDISHSNLAAVNYYFGDKAGYYREVRGYAQSLRLQEIQKLMETETSDPWEALSSHIYDLVGYSYASDLFCAAWMYLREYVEPSAEEYPPRQSREAYDQKVKELLTQLLGDKATEKNIALLHYTYCSLSFFLLLESRRFEGDRDNPFQVKPLYTPEQLRDHIMALVRQTVEKMRAGE